MSYQDESVRYAWAYLLKYGYWTNGEWDYYCGWKHKSPVPLDEILSTGIDWAKTGVPRTRTESTFQGTFDSAADDLVTLGTLVLKDGTTMLIGSEDSQAANLTEAARELIEKRSGLEDLMAKLGGDKL